MPDDQRLSLFLDQWQKDQQDGITPRSIHNRLTGFIDRTDRTMRQLGERVAKVEQNDKRDAEDRANGTGRFRALNGAALAMHDSPPAGLHIPTPVQPIPSPFADGYRPPMATPMVEVNVNTGEEHKPKRRHDSFMSTLLKPTAKKIGGYVAVGIAAALGGHLSGLATSAGSQHTVATAAPATVAETLDASTPAMAPAAPVAAPVVSIPPEPATRPDLPRTKLDAGRH